MMKLLVCLLILALACSIFAEDVDKSRSHQKGLSWRHKMKHGYLLKTQHQRADFPDVQKTYFTQRLNHFDPRDNRTWQQPYYYKDDAYQPGAPVYFFLGGEGPFQPEILKWTYPSQLAKEHCAFLIGLAHRFYDNTLPDYSNEQGLVYLNSKQALYDAATFATYAKEHFNLTGPWLVLGCSYPGSLAAWARAMFPHIFTAAYSCSGPVLAKYNFHGYYDTVSNMLAKTSPQCVANIRSAVKAVREEIQKGNSEYIQKLFGTCTPLKTNSSEDVMLLASGLAMPYGNKVQYAKKGDLEKFCKRFTDTKKKPIEVHAQVAREIYGAGCIAVESEGYNMGLINEYDDTKYWIYQLCTEFGYWMSILPTNKAFGLMPVTADYHQEMCKHSFDPSISAETTKASISRTNMYHGGNMPSASRVLYVHGSGDPWSPLRSISDAGKTSKTILIDGTSHCYDWDEPIWNEVPSAQRARADIRSTIMSWIPKSPQCSA